MGKQLRRQGSDIEYQPSCFGVLIQILDHHHHNHHRTNGKDMIQQNKRRGRGRKRAIWCLHSKTISMERDHGEMESLLVDESEKYTETREIVQVNKSSDKQYLDGENQNQWLVEFPAHPGLQRIDSIHHLEPSDYRLGKMDLANPIIVLRKSAEISDNRVQVSSQKKRATRKNKRSEVSDDLGQNQTQNQIELSRENSRSKVDVLEIFKVDKELFLDVLADPGVVISKQVPGQQKLNKKAKLTKSVSFPLVDVKPSTLEHKRNESWTFFKGEKLLSSIRAHKSNENRSNHMPVNDKTIHTSQDSSHHWWNHSFMGRLRVMKKRIKDAIRESKKEHEHIENTNDLSDNTMRPVSRTSSLIESLDRYAQFFDTKTSEEATLNHSKSLKLQNEDRMSSRERTPKFFRRISSLSEVDSFYSLLNEIAQDSDMQDRSEPDQADSEINNQNPPESSTSIISEASEAGFQQKSPQEQKTIPSESETSFLASEATADNTILTTFQTKMSQDKEYNTLNIDDTSFNYIKDILELSGFIGNDSLQSWYSLDQPLDPAVFKEFERYLHKDSEESTINCDHQLLFELVNETLLEIYDRSFTYFPKPFSFNNRIRPMPEGNSVVEEVWSRISLSFRSEFDQSLDDIVARDLGKSDGWMNHLFESECVALELEELIFDELLREAVCC